MSVPKVTGMQSSEPPTVLIKAPKEPHENKAPTSTLKIPETINNIATSPTREGRSTAIGATTAGSPSEGSAADVAPYGAWSGARGDADPSPLVTPWPSGEVSPSVASRGGAGAGLGRAPELNSS